MHLLKPLVLLAVFSILDASAASLVAKDRFPTGADTPEGVATDFGRAFIARDFAAFEAACLPLYGSESLRAAYGKFREEIRAEMAAEAARPRPSIGAPKAIGIVFVARHLSLNGPASYGYAVHGFDDVMFVDVGMHLWNGKRYLNRTLVVKCKGRWWVHPAPELDPLLSAKLNDESPSTEDWHGEGKDKQTGESAGPAQRR